MSRLPLKVCIGLILFSLSFGPNSVHTLANQDLPPCPVNSYDGLMPPTIGFKPPIITTDLKVMKLPLLPVPIKGRFNPAHFPSVDDSVLIYVIGRSDPSLGDWLYVEVRRPDQVYKYGFIDRAYTTYSGSMNALEIIPTERCDDSSVSGTPRQLPTANITFTSREIDGITISLPENWIFHDFSKGKSPSHEGLKTFIANVQPINGQIPTHLFVAAPKSSATITDFGILYIGKYNGPDVANATDTVALRQALTDNLQNLATMKVYDQTAELIDKDIIDSNGYPFAYVHYAIHGLLDAQSLAENGLQESQNIVDVYNLTTYWQNSWYIFIVTGFRPSVTIQQTIINSIYIPS